MEEIKRIPIELEIKDFLITFKYETWIGHKRKTDKRVIKHFNRQEARDYFRKWAKKIRTMSNVEILDTVELKETRQNIVL